MLHGDHHTKILKKILLYALVLAICGFAFYASYKHFKMTSNSGLKKAEASDNENLVKKKSTPTINIRDIPFKTENSIFSYISNLKLLNNDVNVFETSGFTFEKYIKVIGDALETICNNSISQAAEIEENDGIFILCYKYLNIGKNNIMNYFSNKTDKENKKKLEFKVIELKKLIALKDYIKNDEMIKKVASHIKSGETFGTLLREKDNIHKIFFIYSMIGLEKDTQLLYVNFINNDLIANRIRDNICKLFSANTSLVIGEQHIDNFKCKFSTSINKNQTLDFKNYLLNCIESYLYLEMKRSDMYDKFVKIREQNTALSKLLKKTGVFLVGKYGHEGISGMAYDLVSYTKAIFFNFIEVERAKKSKESNTEDDSFGESLEKAIIVLENENNWIHKIIENKEKVDINKRLSDVNSEDILQKFFSILLAFNLGEEKLDILDLENGGLSDSATNKKNIIRNQKSMEIYVPTSKSFKTYMKYNLELRMIAILHKLRKIYTNN